MRSGKASPLPNGLLSSSRTHLYIAFPEELHWGYWLIATLEALLTLGFLISVFNFVFLPYALLGSLFLFGVLLLGLRITYDFQGSANMFTYFGTTLVALFLVTMT